MGGFLIKTITGKTYKLCDSEPNFLEFFSILGAQEFPLCFLQ